MRRGGEARDGGGDGDSRAGGDEEVFSPQADAVGERDGVRVEETRVAAEEGEALGVVDGLVAVGGEVGDDVFFPRVEGLHVHACGRDAQPEFLGVPGVVEELGGVEEGFGGHAALEDAESAEDGRAIDDGDGLAEVGRDAGGVKAGGAAPENDEIEGFAVDGGTGHGGTIKHTPRRETRWVKEGPRFGGHHQSRRPWSGDRRKATFRQAANLIGVV